MGLVGSFIPVAPHPDKPYSDPAYDTLWAVAEELNHPLLLHIGTPHGFGHEFTMDITELTGAGCSTTDYWVRYSLGSMVFAGVFDKFPASDRLGRARGGVDPALAEADGFHLSRTPVFTKGWRSKEGLLPSDYWKRNMFVEFMEDDLGVQLRDRIGVENMLWGSDYPHAEATFPRSQQFLQRMFDGVPSRSAQDHLGERRQMFGFQLNSRALASPQPARGLRGAIAGGASRQREHKDREARQRYRLKVGSHAASRLKADDRPSAPAEHPLAQCPDNDR